MPLNSPRTYLGSEPGRIRGALMDLEHVLKAEDDATLAARMDMWAPDIIQQLEHAVDRIKRAQTAVEAQRAIARCDAAEQVRVAA